MADPDSNRFEKRTGLSGVELEFLGRLPLFAGIAATEIRSLLAGASVRTYPAKATLFLQGDAAERCYVILGGWVKLYRESLEGQESVIGVLSRGEVFAEPALFSDGAYPVSAQVVEDARLLVILQKPFMRRLREDPQLSSNMLATVSAHWSDLARQIEHLTAKSSAQRLAAFVLELAPNDEGPAVVRLPFDKSLIAGRLGMQPETLSRAIAKLRALGVETLGQDMQIADLGALQDFSEGDSDSTSFSGN